MAWELAALALMAPGLWFPTVRPVLAAASAIALLLLWAVGALFSGRAWPRSPCDLALLCLLAALAASAWRSDLPALTLPKVTSLLLGLGLYRCILSNTRRSRHLWMGIALLLALAMLFSLVGLTNGIVSSKVRTISRAARGLPRWLQSLPEAQFGRASMNQLGGAVLLALPIGMSVALSPRRRQRREMARRIAAGLSTLALLAAILLSQSRSAWIGLAAGMAVYFGLRWQWGRRLLSVALLAACLGWLIWGRVQLSPLVLEALTTRQGAFTPVGTLNVAARVQVWTQAIDWIGSCPIIGCGLGTYRAQFGAPAAPRSVYDSGLPHAHNAFLQVAYDAGLVGLVAYLAVVGVAVHTASRTIRDGVGLPRATAIGALSALVGHHVYGLTDVVALGSKPGVLLWGLLALIAACNRLVPRRRQTGKDPGALPAKTQHQTTGAGDARRMPPSRG
jgi:O-antigen ligase